MGWIGTTNGIVFKTSDAGARWVSQVSGTTSTLLGIHFRDANHGLAVGTNGKVSSLLQSVPAPGISSRPSSDWFPPR
eukprot:5274124-Pyramimonas_sp.AAC.1